MDRVYYIESYEKEIRRCYSNLKKVSNDFPLSYWGMYAAVKKHDIYRKDGYLVIKMKIR